MFRKKYKADDKGNTKKVCRNDSARIRMLRGKTHERRGGLGLRVSQLSHQRRKNESIVLSHSAFLAHTTEVVERRRERKKKPVVYCRGKKYISSSSGCIGESNWRDIIIAILCENPISNISFSHRISSS